MAGLCNTTYSNLPVDLPNLAGWNVAFKGLDTAKNVTVSRLCILRRTITRRSAQAQPDYLGIGFILDDRTDVVIVIADPSQRRIADLDLRSRFVGPWFLLDFAAGSLLNGNRCGITNKIVDIPPGYRMPTFGNIISLRVIDFRGAMPRFAWAC